VTFTVAEKDLIPEGLAVDPSKRVFYLGSLHRRKIVKITESGEVADFVSADQADWGPFCGIKVDPADRSVWANVCSDFGRGAALLHVGLNGKLIERFPAPAGGKHLFNDLVLRNAHEIYLTDSLAHQAYRFDRQSHAFTALSFPRAMYYPNGIALSDDGKWLFIEQPRT
jgi:sugar lactone lactonase YvrE